MLSKSLRTTTALLAVLSLMQPFQALAQPLPRANGNASENGAMPDPGTGNAHARMLSFEEICADAMITDAGACELHLKELLAVAQADAEGAVAAAAQAALEAEAAARAAAEAGVKGKVKAEAQKLERAAADAELRAAQTVDAANLLSAEAEAAAAAAAEAEPAANSAPAADAQTTGKAAGKPIEPAEANGQAAVAAAAAAEKRDRAKAEAQAKAEAKAEVKADAEAEAQADAAAAAAAQAQTEADAVAAGQDGSPASEATAGTSEPPAPVVEECAAALVDADGTLRCVDELTPDTIDAIAAETNTDVQTGGEVAIEEITDDTRRSSSEEFIDQRVDEKAARTVKQGDRQAETTIAANGSGLSSLEKAGLLALGAVVVGAILANGQRVEANTGDRVIVVDDDGSYSVFKDDDALLRQPGSQVRTERYSDGSIRTIVTRPDGTRIITIRDSTGQVLQRRRVDQDGREYLLIDDTRSFEPVAVKDLPKLKYKDFDYRAASDRQGLRQALLAADQRGLGRRYSLRQARDYVEVRELAPEINLRAITFDTNSAALEPPQAERLEQMGLLMRELIRDDPTEIFLIEGHTDAVGSTGYNLLLSDRRAESVALAFSEYFGVPVENMVVQGYGERFLKIPTQEDERLNRRVAVRRITVLLR